MDALRFYTSKNRFISLFNWRQIYLELGLRGTVITCFRAPKQTGRFRANPLSAKKEARKKNLDKNIKYQYEKHLQLQTLRKREGQSAGMCYL